MEGFVREKGWSESTWIAGRSDGGRRREGFLGSVGGGKGVSGRGRESLFWGGWPIGRRCGRWLCRGGGRWCLWWRHRYRFWRRRRRGSRLDRRYSIDYYRLWCLWRRTLRGFLFLLGRRGRGGRFCLGHFRSRWWWLFLLHGVQVDLELKRVRCLCDGLSSTGGLIRAVFSPVHVKCRWGC